MTETKKEKLLVSVCCAPCFIYLEEKYKKKFDIDIFFYGSNIHPESEYNLRKNELKKFTTKKFFITKYNPDNWLSKIKKIKNFHIKNEGGPRCEKCFEIRFRETAKFAIKNNYKNITTTLNQSPHKNDEQIKKVAKKILKEFPSLNFIFFDLKKNNGFQKSCILCKQKKIYRQKYCGCIFSQQKKY